MGRIENFWDGITRGKKKFFVFVVATVLLCVGRLSEEAWLIIVSFYLGMEALVDVVRSRGGSR